MASRQGDIPALESSASTGFLSAFSAPIGMLRRNASFDDDLYAPPHSPTEDFTATIMWREPTKKNKFKSIAKDGEAGGEFVTFEASPQLNSPVHVVKAKCSPIMSSFMHKQPQDKFEQPGGQTDAGINPFKGLSAEETHSHRVRDSPKLKLRMPIGEFKEDRLTPSAQATPSGTPSVTPSVTPCVTPSVTPHSSPALSRRSWLQLSSTPFLTSPEQNSPTRSLEMGGNEGNGGERWSFFGSRSVVQKSPTDPGSETHTGFSLQSYFGLHKSSTMDGTSSQITLKVDDPAKFMPPKIEISEMEAKRAPPPPPRPHKLKPRDINVLTPSGF